MSRSDDARPRHRDVRNGKAGFGVPFAERLHRRQRFNQTARHAADVDDGIDFKILRLFGVDAMRGKIFGQEIPKLVQLFLFQRKSRRHGVTAARRQNAFFLRRQHRRAQIGARDGTPRSVHFVAVPRQHQRRDVIAFFQPSGDNADNARVPIITVSERQPVVPRAAFNLRDRLFVDVFAHLAAQDVQFLQLFGDFDGFGFIARA